MNTARDRRIAAGWLALYVAAFAVMFALLFLFASVAQAEGPTASEHVVPILELFPVENLILFFGIITGVLIGRLKDVGAWLLVLIGKSPAAHRPVCQHDLRELKDGNKEEFTTIWKKLDAFTTEARAEYRQLSESIAKIEGKLSHGRK